MNLQQAAVQHRTLIVEGCDGVSRAGVLDLLGRQYGFTVRRMSVDLDHVDPARPYREALQQPGPLALDGGLVGELVYGPLRRGRSRVTWIQAFDFAEAVAERGGAFLHLTSPAPVLRRRLAAGGVPGARGVPDSAEIDAVVEAYEQAFMTLAHHVPVVTLRIGGRRRRVRPREDRSGPSRLTRIRAPSSGCLDIR